MTKEELEKVKKDYQSLITKLQELDEDEFNEVVGGKEYVIKPPNDPFWQSFNPNFLNSNPNDLGLINNQTQDSPNLDNLKFEGKISNREDND